MGKSRLLLRIPPARRQGATPSSSSGNCSPDGRQTPFLPFIEVVRDSSKLRREKPRSEIAEKLETGLELLGLRSPENLGLLLNLLGLQPPDGALAGLDGVLIGLRTRDLLHRMLEALCRLSPVVLLIEDLHWIDSASQELLGRSSRRRQAAAGYLSHPPAGLRTALARSSACRDLEFEPLPAGDVRRLVEVRLGRDALPEALARHVTERAEGNALFAEEILSFLVNAEHCASTARAWSSTADAVAAALPASLQGLLSARMDRLAPRDRALLQAAAAIGRRFDPNLLAAVADDGADIEARLAAMTALIWSIPRRGPKEYSFKHALVRDTLYQSLLKGPRSALHVKIAEEIERRSGNRLTEVAEALAYHYSQTDRADKAFTYLAMAGERASASIRWMRPTNISPPPNADRRPRGLRQRRASRRVPRWLCGVFAPHDATDRNTGNRRAIHAKTQSPPGSSQLHVDPTPLCIGSARVGSVSGSRTGASAPVRCRGPEPRPAITRLRPCQRHSCFDAHHALSGRRLRSCQP